MKTDVNTVRDGLKDGLLYLAKKVNLEAEQEGRLVEMLREVRNGVFEFGTSGLDLLDDVIAAIQERTADDAA